MDGGGVTKGIVVWGIPPSLPASSGDLDLVPGFFADRSMVDGRRDRFRLWFRFRFGFRGGYARFEGVEPDIDDEQLGVDDVEEYLHVRVDSHDSPP
jgi:hypothetical protein